MTRKFISFPIADLQLTKRQMLNWGDRFNICCFLDNHNYDFAHSSIECLLAAGCKTSLSAATGNALEQFQHFYNTSGDWIFGHLGYDLKNEIESLHSTLPDGIGFPDLFFFVPEVIIQASATEMIIGADGEAHNDIFQQITGIVPDTYPASHKAVAISQRYPKPDYIAAINKLKAHIFKGDCYEVNFCQEFYVQDIYVHALQLYETLSASSPNPFSAYYRNGDKYLLCLSPERYLKKEGTHVISQPIKGTSRRDKDHDSQNIERLMHNDKERAENIMIVDLVRNDLSRICKKGTVKVDELCAVYTFPQVYQMVSTISGDLEENTTVSQAIRATFPMGSMTGAPKKKVMELIEQYEASKRGLFSGSIGYFTPEGDFDLNVVIRSVLYNATSRYLSFHTGSAITSGSDPETEYEECLLKAEAIKKALA